MNDHLDRQPRAGRRPDRPRRRGPAHPGLLQRTCLMEEQRNESNISAWRYFGSRALALGLGYLAADDHQRRHLDRVGLIVDTTDTLFLAAMAARGSLRPSRAAWMGTTTVAATAIGLAAVTRDQ